MFEKEAVSIIREDIRAGNSPFDADEVFHKEMKAYIVIIVQDETQKRLSKTVRSLVITRQEKNY